MKIDKVCVFEIGVGDNDRIIIDSNEDVEVEWPNGTRTRKGSNHNWETRFYKGSYFHKGSYIIIKIIGEATDISIRGMRNTYGNFVVGVGYDLRKISWNSPDGKRSVLRGRNIIVSD